MSSALGKLWIPYEPRFRGAPVLAGVAAWSAVGVFRLAPFMAVAGAVWVWGSVGCVASGAGLGVAAWEVSLEGAETLLLGGIYDPALTWRTLQSPRFLVHFTEGQRNLAVRVSRIAEEVWDDICVLLDNVPADDLIDIVLTDNSDLANGSAQVIPNDVVRLFLSAPTESVGLSAYDDWLRLLIVHELAHIVDLDHTRGVTTVLNWLLGRTVRFNGYTPQMLSEGVAVYAETKLTATGRGRSSYVAMILRLAALQGGMLDVSQANIWYSEWPGPNVAYFYGGLFHLWLEQKYGAEAVKNLHSGIAGNPIPFWYWPVTQHYFGKSVPVLWSEFVAEEARFGRETAKQIRARGVTKSRQITQQGGHLTGVTTSPDGQTILYSRTGVVDGATVRRVSRDGTDDEALVLQTYSPRFSFAADGSAFYYSQASLHARYNTYNDLYRYNLADDTSVKLKDAARPGESLRARSPDVSPDGKRLVFVQNALHQNWISIGRLDGPDDDTLEVEVLVPPKGDRQHSAPRFSPDGKLIAVSTWFEGGTRDVVVFDAITGAMVRRVTSDAALDGDPAWSADGRYVLWASDVDGVSNLYAFDFGGGGGGGVEGGGATGRGKPRYFRITNVVGGAFQPHVTADGAALLFRRASTSGFDIHELPFDPSTWEPLRYKPGHGYVSLAAKTQGEFYGAAEDAPSVWQRGGQEGWQTAGWGEGAFRADEPEVELQESESIGPYAFWRTLLPFQDNWLLVPVLALPPDDFLYGATTVGQDALTHHTYILSVGSTLQAKRLDLTASYLNDMWYVRFGVAYSQAHAYFAVDSNVGEIERRRLAILSASMPIRQRHVLRFVYAYDERKAIQRVFDVPFLATTGQFSFVEAAYAYSNTRNYPYSVGDEDGYRFGTTLRWYADPLGADFNEVMVSFDGRAYVNNPLFDNHVLALRATTALAFGPDYRERFLLGGNLGQSLLNIQTDRRYPLRGFSTGQGPAGIGLFAAYAEYRFPVWHIEKGTDTLPLYFERLSLAPFVDWGNVFGDGTEQDADAWLRAFGRSAKRGRMGAGFEARLNLVAGWQLPLTLRMGFGFPVLFDGKPAGRQGFQPVRFYLWFGQAV